MAMENAVLTGVVARANERGVLLEGHDGWLNISKFATQVENVSPGDSVLIKTDKAGFVRTMTTGGSATSDRPTPATSSSAPRAATFAQHVSSEARSEADAKKSATITRLAILKAVAEYAAPRAQYEPEDVLRIATYWEAWVNEAGKPAAPVGDDE